ncbi:MAG: hypothetical protein ACQER9_04710 [Nanobdellota archaeon]
MKTLIVEDNEKNINAAHQGLDEITNLIIATDYNQAVQNISRYASEIEKAFCDCYFPKETGNDNIYLLGVPAARELTRNIEQEENFKEYLNSAKEFLQHVGFQKRYPELEQKLAVEKLCNSGGKSTIETKASRKALELSLENIEEETLIDGIKSFYDALYYTTSPGRAEPCLKDYFVEMIRNMENDSNQQPLGVEVGKELQCYGIPFMFVTSGSHHGSLTEPFERYAINNKINITTGADKSDPEQWKQLYDRL